MITQIFKKSCKYSRILKNISGVTLVILFLLNLPNVLSQDSALLIYSNISRLDSSHIIYRNPRVYNVQISFEMHSDHIKIDKEHDLKVWIPIPREWDSQKNVRIISVQPEPHSQYIDPEFGNKIFYWDFGKYPVESSYQIKIEARLLSYEVQAMIDSSDILPYDKTTEEFKLYTKSRFTINLSSKVKDLAKEAIGSETNPYLKAQKILTFVHNKIRYDQSTRFNQGINGTLDFMLSKPKINESSGKEYFLGDCTHFSGLFVAICRSEGIPARCVYARIGWGPYLNKQNSKMFSKLDTMVTYEGFAGAQHHGLGPHMWAEFFLQGIGWIPVDPQAGTFGRLHNYKVIMSKGRDIDLGPYAPHKNHNGYGFQWVPINNGKVDGLLSAVYNIEKIADARSNVYHTSDPFPANAIMDYEGNLLSDDNKTLAKKRKEFLSELDYCTRDIPSRAINFGKIYDDPNWLHSLQYKYDEFVCHMLHKILGDKNFFKLFTDYENLLVNSPKPIQTEHFIQMVENINGESMEWFFDQWKKSNRLPHLKINEITIVKENNEWIIKGKLIQSGNPLFVFPVEFSLETEKGRELFTIWQRDKISKFEYQTANKPIVLRVDPYNDILKLQKMPLQLWCIWDSYPDITIIYGTISESEANKTAAERFNNDYLGLSSEIIKPDTSIDNDNLNTACIVLFGRPATNKISQRFENLFPIKFNQDKFDHNGMIYSKPSQGLAQIAQHPLIKKGQLIQYAGLSAKAMLQFGDLYLYDAYNSYLIYDGDKKIISGDWEVDNDLLYKFKK